MKIFDILYYDIFLRIFSTIFDNFHEKSHTIVWLFMKIFEILNWVFFHQINRQTILCLFSWNFRHSILWHFFTNIFDNFRKFSWKKSYYSMTFFMKIFEILNWVFFSPNESTDYTMPFFMKIFDILYYDIFLRIFSTCYSMTFSWKKFRSI